MITVEDMQRLNDALRRNGEVSAKACSHIKKLNGHTHELLKEPLKNNKKEEKTT